MVSPSPESFVTCTSQEGKDGYFAQRGRAYEEVLVASLGFLSKTQSCVRFHLSFIVLKERQKELNVTDELKRDTP